MKVWADKYNELGWVVMPISPNGKIPILKNWSKINSNDETLDKFKDDSNIGIIMGKVSNVICLDIDVKKANGVETLDQLEKELGQLPQTVTSETPSGGIHYYFQYVEGIRNRKNIGKGIDVQANGTQTVECPSQIDGVGYEWVYDPFEYEVAMLPQTWIDMLCEKTDEDKVELVAKPFEPPKEVGEGSRNNTIAQFVGSKLGKKLKKETILKRALKYNQENCEPPLDDSEVVTIVESMIKTDLTNKASKVKESVNHSQPKSVEVEEETELPTWIYFDETGTPFINEKKFAEWYVERNQIHCVNERFFSKYGQISDNWFKNNIQNIIGGIVTNKLSTKVNDLLSAIKNEAYLEVSSPDIFKVQFDNISFDVRSGKLVECEEFFTLHQLPHNYDSKATCPTWIKYINDLFHEEDVPVIQEYLGYCLLPNTLAQTSLFIVGDGGEGKSRITIMLEHILGANSVVIGDFKGLQEKFSLTSLDNQMLFIDDDLSSDALDDTSNFKKIVTAETLLEVEPKGKAKYKTKMYAKILCCGNCAVSSKFDRSDGFYRRLLVSKVKPIENNRKPDRTLIDKLKDETPGIINWFVEGMLRVVNNGFVIKGSERMLHQVQEIKNNNDTMAVFLYDNQYITFTMNKEDRVSMKQLYESYEMWCNDNGYLCIHKTTFSKLIRKTYKNILVSMMAKKYSTDDINEITDIERVYVNKKQVRGFAGIKINNHKKSFTINQ